MIDFYVVYQQINDNLSFYEALFDQEEDYDGGLKVVKGWASYLLIATRILVISLPVFIPVSKFIIDCKILYGCTIPI